MHSSYERIHVRKRFIQFSVCIQLEELNYKNLHDWQRESILKE